MSNLCSVNVRDNILSSIDDIDSIVLESEFNVLNAMLDSYTKATVIMENYSGNAIDSFSIFQEGEIIDDAKGKNTESMIFRILAFIPRLIMAIGKKLLGCSKNNDLHEAVVIMKEAEEDPTPITPEEKSRVQKWREEHADGGVDLDDKKGKFLKFTSNIKGKCHLLGTTKKLLLRIHEVIDKDEPSAYRDLANEFKNIKNTDKKFSTETVSLAFGAVSQLFNDAGLLADETGSIALEAGKKLTDIINEKINDPDADEKTLEKQIAMKDLASSINMVGSCISGTVNSLNSGVDFVKWIWGSAKNKHENGKKKRIKNEIASIKNEIRACEKRKADAKEIKKLREKLANYEAKLANMKGED